MNKEELQRFNRISVFEAILAGENTISAIASKTGLNPFSVKETCRFLIDKGLIYEKADLHSNTGRPPVRFYPTDNHFCAYIEENDDLFSCILIDRLGNAIQRIDKRKNPIVPIELILSRFIRDIKEFDDERNLCRGIFISCYESTTSLLTKEFERISPEDLIVNALKRDDEISLFIFEGKTILNLYGKISTPFVDTSAIEASIPVQHTYTFSRPYYEDIFKILSVHITSKMKEVI